MKIFIVLIFFISSSIANDIHPGLFSWFSASELSFAGGSSLSLAPNSRTVNLAETTVDKSFSTSSEMCDELLKKTGVALLPGSDFGFNSNKMLARLSFTDFDGQEFMKQIDEDKLIDEIIINKFAPKIVEGVDKLKKWSESL